MSNTFTVSVGSIGDVIASPGSFYAQTTPGTATAASWSTAEADLAKALNAGFSGVHGGGGINVNNLSIWENAPPGTGSSAGGTGQIDLNLDTNHITLTGVVSGTFAFSGLPSGFTILSATLNVHTNAGGAGGTTKVLRDGVIIHTTSNDGGTNQSVDLSGNLSNLDIFYDIYGFHFNTVAGNNPPLTTVLSETGSGIPALFVTGTYGISSTSWYYNPVLNQFELFASNPGAPWILQTPTPVITSVVPNFGPKDGTILPLASVTINGSGFGEGAGVTFGGQLATGISVPNQNVITCTTPAYTNGIFTDTYNLTITELGLSQTYALPAHTVDTSVINPDFVTATDPSSFSYLTPQLWEQPFYGWWYISYFPPVLEFSGQPQFPALSTSPLLTSQWDLGGTVVDTKGWWWSHDQIGSTFLATSPGNPQHGRGWDKISNFATGTAAMLGGSPAASATFNNKLIYAGDQYTSGSQNPMLRIFDGIGDRPITYIPNVGSTIPLAIMSVINVGGIIYISTLDSGTTHTTYTGRVFSFDPLTSILTLLPSTILAGTSQVTIFTGGELPYALASYNNKIWVGTNYSDGTTGNIYWIRPGIDTNWTLDSAAGTGINQPRIIQLLSFPPGTTTYTYIVTAVNGTGETGPGIPITITNGTASANLATHPNFLLWTNVPGALSYNVYRTVGGATQGKIVNIAQTNVPQYNDAGAAGDASSPPSSNGTGTFGGGIDSMLGLNGYLYIGTDNKAGSPGYVLQRDPLGVYTISDTGTGGTLRANNGYLNMIVFLNNLYVSYWNPDTPSVSKIRIYNGTSWSTSYTASGDTIRPFIGMFLSQNTLFALGGGDDLAAAVVSTPDGSVWTDLTTNLTNPASTSETLLPIYGVLGF